MTHLEAEGDRRVAVLQLADLTEIDVIGETDHAIGARAIEQKKLQADAREENEEQDREEKDRHRHQASRAEESFSDHAPAAQNARDVDGQTRAIARALKR